MKLVIYPFYSRQNKVTGQFQMDMVGEVACMQFIGERVREELGWEVEAVVPSGCRGTYSFTSLEMYIPNSNPSQRVHWDTATLRDVFSSADVAICHHELMAIPLRALFPKLKIVQWLATDPHDSLFDVAWDRADLVAVQCETAAKVVQKRSQTPTSVWTMGWDERRIVPVSCDRDIDVYFMQRCSSTNYTHHVEFLKTLPLLADLQVLFGDPTNYLKQLRPDLRYVTDRSRYVETLCRSKVVLAMADDLYGGVAVREAIRCGCIPVCLDSLCYRELCGPYWPYCTDPTPLKIAATVRAALGASDCSIPYANALKDTYQNAWLTIKKDLTSL